MNLEAWGDENPMDAGPWRDCKTCDGSGELQTVFDSLLMCWECPHCHGSGQVPDEYEPWEDDYL